MIQFNVGSAFIGQGAIIEAKGFGGAGGVISINARDVVNVARQAILDTSGKTIGTFDSNVISIEGGAVNVEGLLRANGIVTDGVASKGGTIQLVANGLADSGCFNCAVDSVQSGPSPLFTAEEYTDLVNRHQDLVDNHSGNVRVGSTGKLLAEGASITLGDTLSGPFAKAGNGGSIFLTASSDILFGHDPASPANAAFASANGGHGGLFGGTRVDGGNGGLIFFGAGKTIDFAGSAHARGGNGYTPRAHRPEVAGNIEGGIGGSGGVLAFGYGDSFNNTVVSELNKVVVEGTGLSSYLIFNTHQIDAKAGNNGFGATQARQQLNAKGGLVVFSGPSNPTALSNISVYRGQFEDGATAVPGLGNIEARYQRFGTVVLPNETDPLVADLLATNTDIKQPLLNPAWTGLNVTVDRTANNELISHNENLLLLSKGGGQTLLSDRVADATARSTTNQTGGAEAEIADKANVDVNGGYQNLVAFNSEDADLELDPVLGLDRNLNNLTVYTAGGLLIPENVTWATGFRGRLEGGVGGNYIETFAPLGGRTSLLAAGEIINLGTLASKGWISGGHISLASDSAIINLGTIATVPNIDQQQVYYPGGAIDFLNPGGSVHGGSIILKASDAILNLADPGTGQVGLISANSRLVGGTVQIATDFLFANAGVIRANGGPDGNADFGTVFAGESGAPQGGYISAESGALNLNIGLIQANGVGSGAEGGYVHLDSGTVTGNANIAPLEPFFDFNSVEANGANRGGRVVMTAGGNPLTIPSGTLTTLLGTTTLPGFGVQTLTPPVTTLATTVDLTIPESVYNFGNVSARDLSNSGAGGRIYLAGNGQVGLGFGSTLNNVVVDGAGILSSPNPAAALQTQLAQPNGGRVYVVAGQSITGDSGLTRSAVSLVACDAAPNSLAPDVNPDANPNPQGAEFPTDFTLAADASDTLTVPLTDDSLDFSLLGLFQDGRPIPPEGGAPPSSIASIIFSQPRMFLARAYSSVTQSILNQALQSYQNQMAGGANATQAQQAVVQYLQQSGVDKATALLLVQRIEAGSLNVDAAIVPILKALAG